MNREALKIYRDAFMAIDQLNAGWYGGFAVECLAQGVPVISYLRDLDLHFLPIEMKDQLPIVNACHCNLKDKILDCINFSPIDYESLSQRSIDFVSYWHDPEKIASQIAKDYL
jgi:hypothetical protein